MANDTEDLTISLGIVDLAQIDVLVGQGFYSGRSDFIRTAVRNHLSGYEDRLRQQLDAGETPGKKHWIKVTGIYPLSRRELEKYAEENVKLNIKIIGMLVVSSEISADLFARTVESATVHGKIMAAPEIKEIISKLS